VDGSLLDLSPEVRLAGRCLGMKPIGEQVQCHSGLPDASLMVVDPGDCPRWPKTVFLE
jgi:hypothetical protein